MPDVTPAAVSTSESNANPGFNPAPRILTPWACARVSSSLANSLLKYHGNAASSAVVMTFDPDMTAARMSGPTSERKEVVATTTTSAPDRSAWSRSVRRKGPETS